MLWRKFTVQAAALAADVAGYEFTAYRFPHVELTDSSTLGLGLAERADGLTRVVSIHPSTQAALHPALRPGLVLLVVNRDSVVGATHEQILQLLRKSSRPISLDFIRLEDDDDNDDDDNEAGREEGVGAYDESVEVRDNAGAGVARNGSGDLTYSPLGRHPKPRCRFWSAFVGLVLVGLICWLLWQLCFLENLLEQENEELQVDMKEQKLLVC